VLWRWRVSVFFRGLKDGMVKGCVACEYME
jgi:hypothetical protein